MIIFYEEARGNVTSAKSRRMSNAKIFKRTVQHCCKSESLKLNFTATSLQKVIIKFWRLKF